MADNPDVNPPNPQYHLLIKRSENNQQIYTLYADDDTFPQRKLDIQAPELVTTLRKLISGPILLNSIDGWQFFYGEYDDLPDTKWAVGWNPITKECFRINVTANEGYASSVVGFGVHPVTRLIKVVKISFRAPNDKAPSAFRRFDVDVCTWDEPVPGKWTNVITDGPFVSADLVECSKVSVGGVVYFRASDGPVDQRSNFFYSFSLETEVFGFVPLPLGLKNTPSFIQSANVNGSLGLLVYHDGACVVWTKKEGAKGFDIIHTIKFEGHLYGNVLGFRNNGEAVIELRDDGVAKIGLYDFPTGHSNRDVGIKGGVPNSYVVRPYFGNVAYD